MFTLKQDMNLAMGRGRRETQRHGGCLDKVFVSRQVLCLSRHK
ncbi:MAG: hypothetical protein EZS28_038939, partial [Streblomastix strix]